MKAYLEAGDDDVGYTESMETSSIPLAHRIYSSILTEVLVILKVKVNTQDYGLFTDALSTV
jgi:hypothetical protein